MENTVILSDSEVADYLNWKRHRHEKHLDGFVKPDDESDSDSVYSDSESESEYSGSDSDDEGQYVCIDCRRTGA